MADQTFLNQVSILVDYLTYTDKKTESNVCKKFLEQTGALVTGAATATFFGKTTKQNPDPKKSPKPSPT